MGSSFFPFLFFVAFDIPISLSFGIYTFTPSAILVYIYDLPLLLKINIDVGNFNHRDCVYIKNRGIRLLGLFVFIIRLFNLPELYRASFFHASNFNMNGFNPFPLTYEIFNFAIKKPLKDYDY